MRLAIGCLCAGAVLLVALFVAYYAVSMWWTGVTDKPWPECPWCESRDEHRAHRSTMRLITIVLSVTALTLGAIWGLS